jgi:gliding motility-associated-like protein
VDVSATAPGTYNVTNTHFASGGCGTVTYSTTITIDAPAVATFSYTGTPYCQDAADPSPAFSGGGAPGTFSSTSGLVFTNTSTGEVDLSASTPGTYTVTNTIPASGGCAAVTASSSITIDPVNSSAFSYPGSTFCQSGTDPVPTITGVTGGTFSANPAGLVFVNTTTGEVDLSASTLNTYTITYASPNPCSTTSIASITITNAPDATFSYTGSPYCQNDADPSPTFSAGGSAGVFSSTTGLIFTSTSTGIVDLSASTPGTYSVTNTIAASGGCPVSTATSPVTINAVPDSSFSYSAASFCQSGTTIPTITGASGGIFTANPAGLNFVSTNTGEINLASSTVGSYAVTYSLSGPCPSSMTVSLSITPAPDANFTYSASSYCKNDPNPSPVFTGSATAGTFSSTTGLSFVSTSTGEVNLSASTAGTYTITNTIAASGNCPATSATFDITINDAPSTAVNSAVICNGQSATLNASGANSYSWNTGQTTSSITVSPTATTSYTVTGTTNGCSQTATGNVVVNNCNEPVADFTGDPTTMCEAGCVNFTDLSSNSPTSWTWSFPGASPSTSTVQNPTNICYSSEGSYDVTLIVSNASGADTLTKPGFITIGSPVQVEITGNLLITSCETTTLTAVPGDGTYEWGPSSTLSSTSGVSVTASPPETQEYYVTYTSPDGCKDSDTTTVVVEDINTYFLPTGFTPNNDGVNDEVHLHGRGIDYFTLRIFDRIGEKVFETSDLEKGWNGKLLGLPMNDGVFVYTLDITFCNGEKVKQHGDITLVK